MELAATAISAASNTAKGNQFSKCLLDLPGSASNSRKGTAPKVTAAVSCTAKMTLGSTLKAGVMFPRRFATIFRKAVVPSAKNACANTFPRKRKSRSRNPRRNPGNAASGCAETSRLMGSAPTATTAVSSMAPTTPASPTPAPKRKQTADPPAAGEGKTPRKKMATVPRVKVTRLPAADAALAKSALLTTTKNATITRPVVAASVTTAAASMSEMSPLSLLRRSTRCATSFKLAGAASEITAVASTSELTLNRSRE
mmetsp:Transcript_14897/g.21023  ORF Transcript_14897/g.21023 Transcript_14897/m.21023 type:complete len:256 (-) Transcript_14897:115-882(-)